MFKKTPVEGLTEANSHAKLSCSNLLLNNVICISFSDKKLFTATSINSQDDLDASAATKNKTPSSHKNDIQSFADAALTDRLLKLDYTSFIFVDLRLKFDRIYYCDLLLSQ